MLRHRAILAATVALITFALVPEKSGAAHVTAPRVLLSGADRAIGAHASLVAGRSTEAAIRWLGGQRRVTRVAMGRDRKTLLMYFRDGAWATILPSALKPVRSVFVPVAHVSIRPRSAPASNGRAIVLEPFADELNLGADAGSVESGLLQQAGYQVTLLKNTQVTVPVMFTLSQYSFVYWNTHAGLLNNGDVVVVTGEDNPKPYGQYYKDNTLVQAFVAGDPTKTLYNGITGAFVKAHIGQFPAHSVWFVNGCHGLEGEAFWNGLHAEGIDALISWNQQAEVSQDVRAGEFVMGQLAQNRSVETAITNAVQQGFGEGSDNGVPAVLGYRGDGSMTLAESLTGVAPTPTVTPTGTLTPPATATNRPIPTATPVSTLAPPKLFLRLSLAKHKLRPGSKQTVTVRTAAHASVSIVVRFPNNATKKHAGTANSKGTLHWTYTQPRGTTTKHSHYVKVTVHVRDAAGSSNGATKRYSTR